MSEEQPAPKLSLKQKRKLQEQEELESLESKVAQPDNYVDTKFFDDLPISTKTRKGLKRSNFRQLTDIQRKAIPLALAKRDVLGAAKTGSGKTLSFLVPVLEILYRARWNAADGLGALIISPTRELAVQIFEVLKKIGREHSFSAGLIIGGKDFKVEQERVSRMNILVATPGRLLQHMDQSVGFDCDNLQALVLDEADRILDMGFQKTVNAIIENLPRSRQTMLFSATQTRSVKDLARLSLQDPEYVAVHEKSEHSTPHNLTQHYVVCELHKKLDVLFSFIRSHLQSKTIVFMSSCKQTRFVYEAFCKLQPGISLLHLHGKQKQTKRVEIFRKFTTTQHAVLFSTDIAARGLDFPAVDWVLQLDCPEDADTYIHRVGRTARFDASGHSLLLLLPTEVEGMMEELKKKKVPIEEIKVRDSKQQSVQKQLQSYCFQDSEMKYLGQRAFVSYMRSVFLQRNKNIFKATELPTEEYAASLGLAGTPKIKFINKAKAKETAASQLLEEEKEEEDEEEDEEKEKDRVRTKYDRMFQRKNQDILSEHYNKLVDFANDTVTKDDDGDDFLTIQRKDHDLESEPEEDINELVSENISKRQAKMTKKHVAKKQTKGERIVFDDEGNPHQLYEMVNEEEFLKDGDAKAQKEAYISEETKAMETADWEDKATAKQKRKEKREKRKLRKQQELMEARKERGEDVDEVVYTLGSGAEDSYSDASMSEYSSDEEEDEEREAFKRKWREAQEDEEDESRSGKKRVIETDEPVTLADQEALALKLLGA
ncbi:P-loop containing nucleoside triphosphate hydrolase protein [Zychaea mexicana]|uniref:P-loop containing nucleoside triphosphate hydrolase protein n=1 Tax=Zychaea mexicana TaxID=64656 RepID=UPI0022FE61A1|nr:P-loop containing nucleoside triphosphate hydrolase protein [Zychaea mexicana]KAI9497327.1 P-loop containing nucleoside triphosphate hydrolase protein [Zychaea mexicana]